MRCLLKACFIHVCVDHTSSKDDIIEPVRITTSINFVASSSDNPPWPLPGLPQNEHDFLFPLEITPEAEKVWTDDFSDCLHFNTDNESLLKDEWAYVYLRLYYIYFLNTHVYLASNGKIQTTREGLSFIRF